MKSIVSDLTGGDIDFTSSRRSDEANLHGNNRIFLSHGHSPAWEKLRDYLTNHLRIEYEEFNRISVAGLTIKERLLQMLDASSFAFIVLTAEDEFNDKSMRARENVVHELGLFQGRLGFEKAIILLEQGCHEFSNIYGVNQIRFRRNDISSCFKEVTFVLKREGMIFS